MIYEKELTEEKARTLINKLENLRYERESERITDIGICHMILKNRTEACNAFEKAYGMDPTEYVARKLIYCYLISEEIDKLDAMVPAMCQQGFTAGDFSERTLKNLMKQGREPSCRAIVQNKWCKISECAKHLFRAGWYSELRTLIDEELDLNSEEIDSEKATAVQYWVKLHAVRKEYDAINAGYKNASPIYKRAIVKAVCADPDLKNSILMVAFFETVYADSECSDMAIATKLVMLYKTSGQAEKAEELAKTIIKKEWDGAFFAINHLSRIMEVCEALGTIEPNNETKKAIKQMMSFLFAADKLCK